MPPCLDRVDATLKSIIIKDISKGSIYFTTYPRYRGFPRRENRSFAGKQQDGSEVVLMGDFNAHFLEEGASLECRTSLLDRVNTELSLITMSWSPVTTGKFTWERKNTKSMFWGIRNFGKSK